MPELLPDDERRRISGLVSGERILHPEDPEAALTYDAVLVGTGRLGIDELNAATPAFLGSVRWAYFVEKGYERVKVLEELANGPDPFDTNAGAEQRKKNLAAAQRQARKDLRAMRTLLMLD